MLSQVDEDEEILNAVKAGAVGYLLKGDATSAGLTDAVRRVARGETIFTPSLAGLVLEELHHPSTASTTASFTERERQVLRMAARGHTEPRIAEELSLTLGEVRNQLRSVTFKLQREHTAHIATDHGEKGPAACRPPRSGGAPLGIGPRSPAT